MKVTLGINFKVRFTGLISAILLVLMGCSLTAACTQQAVSAAINSTGTPSSQSATLQPSASLAASPTVTVPSTATPTATPVPPVILTFPSQVPLPVSDWRPPLYDIPLALNPNDHFYLGRPIALDKVNWPLPDYRYGYIYPRLENMHTGVDIVVALDTPVLAAADGKVVFAGYGLQKGAGSLDDPYGIAVVIRHNFSFDNRTILTVYAHLKQTTVQVGEYVKQGDQVGNVGVTGATSGPHLHFEIRLEEGEDFQIQNPELWMVPPIGYGVLAGRIMNTYGSLLPEMEVWVKSLETGDHWTINTYAARMNQVDPYYHENLVLSDLPAGDYEISLYFYGWLEKQKITIHPGAVNFFQFYGSKGFVIGDPAPPSPSEFLKPAH